MAAWKASIFVAFAFIGSTVLLSKQLDNAFVVQQHYAPKIARLTVLPDEVWQIDKGTHFYRLC